MAGGASLALSIVIDAAANIAANAAKLLAISMIILHVYLTFPDFIGIADGISMCRL